MKLPASRVSHIWKWFHRFVQACPHGKFMCLVRSKRREFTQKFQVGGDEITVSFL
eukprot:TRINITY_DN15824_c0_g1_i1.p1 TRINITY_DN15824_c0_g1~~TRINITY_DN15824_c0_g1_i1.p1  ORF type:complete len:55 (-),score=7.87 TRINITY_DN15824_c0_g1_i1:55-219(-)